jgi:hypothetical protein
VLAWRNSPETFARIAAENQLPGNDPAAVAMLELWEKELKSKSTAARSRRLDRPRRVCDNIDARRAGPEHLQIN